MHNRFKGPLKSEWSVIIHSGKQNSSSKAKDFQLAVEKENISVSPTSFRVLEGILEEGEIADQAEDSEPEETQTDPKLNSNPSDENLPQVQLANKKSQRRKYTNKKDIMKAAAKKMNTRASSPKC